MADTTAASAEENQRNKANFGSRRDGKSGQREVTKQTQPADFSALTLIAL
jgi:hypothetical protein